MDASGAVTRNAYTPYGTKRAGSNVASAHGWLNQIADADTGLTYLNARYYDPHLGRFLSPDPLMNPGDPRTLDPYAYSANNPVAYSDASGLCYGLSGQEMIDCANGSRLSIGMHQRARDSVATGARHEVHFVPNAKSSTYGGFFIEEAAVGSNILGGDFKSRGDDRGMSSHRDTVLRRSRVSWNVDEATGVLDIRLNTSCDDDEDKCAGPNVRHLEVTTAAPGQVDRFSICSERHGCHTLNSRTRPAADLLIDYVGVDSVVSLPWATPALKQQLRMNWRQDGTVEVDIYGSPYPSVEAYVVRGSVGVRILADSAKGKSPGRALAFGAERVLHGAG